MKPIPRGAFPKRRKGSRSKASRKLREDISNLYSEIVEGEAIAHLRLPGWEDAKNVMESGLACMTKIAAQEQDIEIAYKASGFLIEYAQRAMEREGKPERSAELMQTLESLYRRALPERAGELVDVVEDTEPAQNRQA